MHTCVVHVQYRQDPGEPQDVLEKRELTLIQWGSGPTLPPPCQQKSWAAALADVQTSRTQTTPKKQVEIV